MWTTLFIVVFLTSIALGLTGIIINSANGWKFRLWPVLLVVSGWQKSPDWVSFRPARMRVWRMRTRGRCTANIAAVEADLALGHASMVATAASAAAVTWAGQTLRVLAQHLFHGSDPGHQTEAIKWDVHILPRRFKARHPRNRWRCGNVRHGVALLWEFDTPSLTVQGGQRLHSYFNIDRGNPPVSRRVNSSQAPGDDPTLINRVAG
jgi:hypothetical protein